MTLQEAVENIINLGVTDPGEVVATVRRRYDDKWLAQELLENADEVLREIARQMLGARRRSAQSIASVATLDKREIMLQSVFLPGLGWVEFGKFTADHWDQLAGRYRKGAAALSRYAEWCESNAALMREQAVEEFRQVKGKLPELPPAEEAA